MVSVLGAYTNETSLFPSAPTQQSNLLTQITNNTATRFAQKKVDIDEVYKQQSANIDAESNRWVSVKAGIYNAKAAIDANVDSIATIAATLSNMRDAVSESGQKGEDPKYRSSLFDGMLSSINSEAERVGPASNLIGSRSPADWTRNKVQYRNDLGIGLTTLNGAYAGADFRIQTSDGKVWIPDSGSNILTEYSAVQGVKQTITVSDSSGTATLDKSAVTTNITMTSYDAKTGAIQLQVTINPSDPPLTVNGTLTKDGIGMMPSWYYDGLKTDAGRQRAYHDINEAQAQLTSTGSTVQVASNQVAMDSRKADDAINALNKQNTAAQQTQLEGLQKLQLDYQRQVQAMQNNLDTLSKQQTNYLTAFASAIGDDSMLDVLV